MMTVEESSGALGALGALGAFVIFGNTSLIEMDNSLIIIILQEN